MSSELSFFLAYMATYIGIIPSIIALFRIKGASPEHRLLALLVWGGTGIALLSALLIEFGIHNLFLLHIYTLFNFVMMSIIFRPFIHPKLFYPLVILFCAFALYRSVGVEQLETMNVLNRSISAFIIMFYTLSFFLKTLKEMKIQRLELVWAYHAFKSMTFLARKLRAGFLGFSKT